MQLYLRVQTEGEWRRCRRESLLIIDTVPSEDMRHAFRAGSNVYRGKEERRLAPSADVCFLLQVQWGCESLG